MQELIRKKKRTVRKTVGYALKKGYIQKEPCDVCGKVKVEAHHSDYTQPLAVCWLCTKHHAEWHKYDSRQPGGSLVVFSLGLKHDPEQIELQNKIEEDLLWV